MLKNVLFVIQEDETNTLINASWSTSCWDIRDTCYETFIDKSFKERRVFITEDVPKLFLTTNQEVCVVYFRDGYSPAYPTEAEWGVRELIESSYAIKCPTITSWWGQKIQQVLSSAGVLKNFVEGRCPKSPEMFRRVVQSTMTVLQLQSKIRTLCFETAARRRRQ